MKLFTIYGESDREFDNVCGKGFIEAESIVEAVQICLRKIGDTDASEENVQNWLGEERNGVYLYSDDWGVFVYVGESKLDVLDVYSDFS